MNMEETIDLGFFFKVLKRHLLFIIIIGILFGGAGYALSNYCVPKKYESNALLYVENSQNVADTVNINDINAAQKMVKTCQIIFKSGTIMDKLIANLDLPYNKGQLSNMITAEPVNSTEVLRLTVECGNAAEAERIVNELVKLSQEEFKRVIKSGSIEVIDYGEVNTSPSFPNVSMLTVVAVVAGLALAYVISFMKEIMDVAVKESDNLAQLYDVPVFAEITDFENPGVKKYGYGKKAAAPSQSVQGNVSERFISDSTPFAVTEAYNTARTNTMFSVSTGKRKIIAFTSANPSEGKSTTCANFAISFANAGFRVLLVECDMRKPTVAKNFDIKPQNGLSTVLGGFCTVSEAINKNVMNGLDVIVAGDIPPNPSELLGSEAMKTFLAASAESYDYVFLDTPPVNLVTDSQLMNDVIAGIVFVVRENSTTHPDIQSALEKIRLANGKTLGFIKTFGMASRSGRYGKKYGYGSYKYEYSEKGKKK